MADPESKRDAFRRLATKRTNTVINHIRILGHCANPQLYEYSHDDVKRIFRAIESELKLVKGRFQNSSRSDFEL